MAAQTKGRLILTNGADGTRVAVAPARLVLAGYTGRNRGQVQRHVDELRALGIPAPDRVPEVYPGQAHGIQIDGTLGPGAGRSSGEVEYVLFSTGGNLFFGVGSDHTDRDLERTSVVAAKQAFPKIVGSRVWPLERWAANWDSLLLRSWLESGGQRRLCQEGSLEALIAPADLLQLVGAQDGEEGLVVFSGTVAALEPAPTEGRCRFEGRIESSNGEVLCEVDYEYVASPAPAAGS